MCIASYSECLTFIDVQKVHVSWKFSERFPLRFVFYYGKSSILHPSVCLNIYPSIIHPSSDTSVHSLTAPTHMWDSVSHTHTHTHTRHLLACTHTYMSPTSTYTHTHTHTHTHTQGFTIKLNQDAELSWLVSTLCSHLQTGRAEQARWDMNWSFVYLKTILLSLYLLFFPSNKPICTHTLNASAAP